MPVVLDPRRPAAHRRPCPLGSSERCWTMRSRSSGSDGPLVDLAFVERERAGELAEVLAEDEPAAMQA